MFKKIWQKLFGPRLFTRPYTDNPAVAFKDGKVLRADGKWYDIPKAPKGAEWHKLP